MTELIRDISGLIECVCVGHRGPTAPPGAGRRQTPQRHEEPGGETDARAGGCERPQGGAGHQGLTPQEAEALHQTGASDPHFVVVSVT